MPAAELAQHFTTAFLAQVPPARFNAVLAGLHATGNWRIASLDAGTKTNALSATIVAGTTEAGIEISTDPQGLIQGLLLRPAPPLPAAPASWAALDREATSLAPDTGFEAATITPTGRCATVNAVSAMTARPLGSMFKLYVLAAVAARVAAGQLSWNTPVALTPGLRSLPSGLLQTEPPGTRFTVAELADLMISSSDNTAADTLAALVGRPAIEAQARRTSSHASLDTPFLRTRELFVLKYADYPRYAQAYLARPAGERQAYLDNVIDRVPLSAISASAASVAAPRDIGRLEWFASPSDLCAAFSALYQDARTTSLAPVATAMSINNGGIGLPVPRWPLLWFKGGSEPGVLTLGYLARSANGTVAVVVLELSDPDKALDETTLTPKAVALISAAFGLIR